MHANIYRHTVLRYTKYLAHRSFCLVGAKLLFYFCHAVLSLAYLEASAKEIGRNYVLCLKIQFNISSLSVLGSNGIRVPALRI